MSRRATQRRILLALSGILIAVWALTHYGTISLADQLRRGTGILWVLLPLHALIVGLDAAAWGHLVYAAPVGRRASRLFLMWSALVRDAVGNLMPLSKLGGDAVGVRLLFARIRHLPFAVASIAAELGVRAIALSVYWSIGLALALEDSNVIDRNFLTAGSIVIVIVGSAVAGALLLRGFQPGTRPAFLKASRTPQWMQSLHGRFARVRICLRQLSAQRDRLRDACVLQLAALVLGTLESLLILDDLGHAVPWRVAFILESLVQGTRTLFGFIPAGIGVQELGLAFAATAYGITPETGLAISVIKRLRELLLGLPFLMSWQYWEWRHAG
jgi:putative membrane protein